MNKYERQPEYILDLHGKTTREAGEILENIILDKQYRHIRIITGKGLYRETGPVMRTFVENYLQKEGIKFNIAKLYHGGEGALEVYLS